MTGALATAVPTMKTTMKIWISVLLVTSTLLVSCVNAPQNVLNRQHEMTMAQLIQLNAKTTSDNTVHERYVHGTTRGIESDVLLENKNMDNYTAIAAQEIEQLFPMLPNPQIVVYIYPHMATSTRAPVPGYTTAISLYERDEYALPNEMTRSWRHYQ